jgi:DNA-binding transcriptional MerR regulator
MVRPGWADLDRGLFSISVAAELAGLHPQTLRIYLAGIRRVLDLQEETRQLQAEVARLRELAGDRTAASAARGRKPREITSN